MVGAATKLARTARSSHRSRHYYFVEERLGGNRITPAGTFGMPFLEVFEGIQHPSEPVDLDQPACCPPPDSNTMRDGEMWRETVARKVRHQLGEKVWDEGDSALALRTTAKPPPRTRVLHSPREKYLFTKHSYTAPTLECGATVIRTIVE